MVMNRSFASRANASRTGIRPRPSSQASDCPPPTPRPPDPPTQGYALRPTNPHALSQVPTEELLLELRRRIIAPRHQRQDTWHDCNGLDPQSDWAEEG